MAIICPPGSVAKNEQPSSGWKVSRNAYGDNISKKSHQTWHSLKAWSQPCSLLGGATLYETNKALLTYLAKFWKTGYAQTIGWTSANGASHPYTNLHGAYHGHNGFQLWMHCQRCSAFAQALSTAPWRYPIPTLGPSAFQTGFHESDMPPGAIIDAHWYSNNTYSITTNNWDPYGSSVGEAGIYISAPGKKYLYATSLFQVDVTVATYTATTQIWTDGGRGVPACLIKPVPVGIPLMLGIRGLFGGANNGVLPSPLAAVLVECEAP